MCMAKWFVTWDRPEYKEWAKEIKEGYLLVVIRKELDNYLCVKAELLMGSKGLPDFKVFEERNVSTQKEADKIIQAWKNNIP